MKKLLFLYCVFACFAVQAVHLEGQAQLLADNALSRMESAFNSMDSEITPEDAYYLGRAVAANILAAYKPYNQNPELTRYLNRICQTLAINSSQPVSFNGYHVIILDSPEFNAFATSGGHIFVTQKLAAAAASEDMLAAVIAHELAHITLKHSVTVINDMKFTNEMSAAASQAAAFAGNSDAAKRLVQFRESVSKSIDTMMKNGYSHAQEFEADQEAAALLARAGYNPVALTEVLKVLQKTQSSQKGGFNSTHPSPAERIANVEKLRFRTANTGRYRASRFKEKFHFP
ncbi:MAG: M48 family metalloprotease [Treponema sp.]|jgi:predicted Zn-dependent protease|nr:M48 family metalloprotease [Treponema sp.]